MTQEVYRKLAQRLDAIPNGFPATQSGSELRLLSKIFEPEEAALAAVMRLTPELAAEIAARAGMDADTAARILKGMARKGLIHAGRGEGQLSFWLMPFVIGFYEAQLPRMDAELATLFEQYYQETRGRIMEYGPTPLHRVIPVEAAIPHQLTIFPYERASELMAKAKAWAVQDCICRVQQRMIGKGCDRPVDNCLTFSSVEGAFDHSKTHRALTREEALRVLQEAAAAGLVHSTFNHRSGNFYICNCCTCCCGVLRGVAEFGLPTTVASSDFRATADADACIGCGKCAERCPFGALSVLEDVSKVNETRCLGCGLCTTVCPSGALRLERRPEGQVVPPPADMNEWMNKRAGERGISLTDIL